jgi:hypothetical protein
MKIETYQDRHWRFRARVTDGALRLWSYPMKLTWSGGPVEESHNDYTAVQRAIEAYFCARIMGIFQGDWVAVPGTTLYGLTLVSCAGLDPYVIQDPEHYTRPLVERPS